MPCGRRSRVVTKKPGNREKEPAQGHRQQHPGEIFPTPHPASPGKPAIAHTRGMHISTMHASMKPPFELSQTMANAHGLMPSPGRTASLRLAHTTNARRTLPPPRIIIAAALPGAREGEGN